MTDDDDVLDSVFHGCALKAYLEVWARTRQFPPDSETTRRLAYQYYEQELAKKEPPQVAGRQQPLPSARSWPGMRSARGGRPSRQPIFGLNQRYLPCPPISSGR